jgi:hypothetical protein
MFASTRTVASAKIYISRNLKQSIYARRDDVESTSHRVVASGSYWLFDLARAPSAECTEALELVGREEVEVQPPASVVKNFHYRKIL